MRRLNTEIFIQRAKEVHGETYDYSQSVYKNKRTKLTIICPIHGPFQQTPHNHVTSGQGCPKCGQKYAKEWRKNNYQHFVDEGNKRFDNGYEYPDIERQYENSHSTITIKCKTCGTLFEKIACDHLTSKYGGCPHCHVGHSYVEDKIGDFIKSILPENTDIRFGDRRTLQNLELDIYVPEYSIAIEYNGLYWHSELTGKGRNYHLMKTEACKSKNIGLIQIFEDEWVDKPDIVRSKLRHAFNMNNSLKKIHARKCTVQEISYNEAKRFLDTNHIQGACTSTVYLGAFFDNNLIGAMTFKKETCNGGSWELTRFATDNGSVCRGVAGKLFKYFVHTYNPLKIKSFADRRWTINETDNLYIKLGFSFDGYVPPDYQYFMGNEPKRYHKFGFRKQILVKKYGFSMDMTESEMTRKLKITRVWNCGLIRYVWSADNTNNYAKRKKT